MKTMNQAPHHYPRRVLLCVAGLTPQVVTETLYALAVHQKPPFIPTEVHVITTSEGASRIRLALLSETKGWFRRLLEDYGLPEITFSTDHIHVVKGGTENRSTTSARPKTTPASPTLSPKRFGN